MKWLYLSLLYTITYKWTKSNEKNEHFNFGMATSLGKRKLNSNLLKSAEKSILRRKESCRDIT